MGLKLIKRGLNLEELHPEQNAEERKKREGKLKGLMNKYKISVSSISGSWKELPFNKLSVNQKTALFIESGLPIPNDLYPLIGSPTQLEKDIQNAKVKGHIRKYNDLLFIMNELKKKVPKRLRIYKIPGITVIENYDYMIGVLFYEDLEDQNKEPYQVQIFRIPDPKIEELTRILKIRLGRLGKSIKKENDINDFKFDSYKPEESHYKNYDSYNRAIEKYNYRKKKAWEKEKEKKSKEKDKIETTLKSFDYYIYQNNFYSFNKSDSYSEQEKKLLIKEHYFKQEKNFQRLQEEIKLFEKLESMKKSEFQQSREPIPKEVRFAIWRRDSGKCVKCGSNKNLEFDHIIPAAKGGSNTERNIQLLCEKCNREKSDKI